MPEAENIAILLPNWVGDVAMATPALRALRNRFAEARITHVGRALALETLAGGDLADARLSDCSRQRPKLLNFPRQVRRMRRQQFDLAVLLPNSFRSALLCYLGLAQRIAGYDRDGRGWMLTDKLSPPRDEKGRLLPTPTIDYYGVLAEILGAKLESRRMSLPVTNVGEAAAEALLQSAGVDRSGPVVMLNPGASFGASKLWPAESYAALADALIERRGAQVIINAAPAERVVAGQVAHAMAGKAAINLTECDNTITLLKSLMRRCLLLITNDTGARHIAAAMGIGVVTIFGSSDPAWSRIDYPRERIVRVEVPCGPCQRKKCPLPAGPEYHQCMTAVAPEMVLEAAEELLDQPAELAEEGRA